MYDYMRALRKKFYTPPGSEALRRELDAVHADLHERLNRKERKLLLRITDLQCSMQDEASLHSFFAGYKLASGTASWHRSRNTPSTRTRRKQRRQPI